MYCHECGTQLPDGAMFCPNCGTGTGSAASTTQGSTGGRTDDGRFADCAGKTSALSLRYDCGSGHFGGSGVDAVYQLRK